MKKVEAAISPGSNINYIREFHFTQDFDRFRNEYWMLTDNDVNVEAAILIPHNMRWQEFYGHKTTHYEDFVFGKERPDSLYTSTDDIAMEDTADERGLSYWRKERPVPLTDNEKAVFEITDSIKQTPHYKVLRSLAKGFAEVGPIEIGPFFAIYSFNPIEGNRFRLGGRTSAPLDGNLVMDGYAAYGLKDDEFKYGGSARYFFQRNPTWDYLSASYRKDLEQLGKSQTIFRDDNILTSAFRRNPANKLNGVEEYRLSYNKEWPLGLAHILQVQRRTIRPLGALEYQKSVDGELQQVKDITTTEAMASFHFGFKERYYTTDYRRFSLGSNYPILDMNFTYGFKDLLGGDHEYQKLIARISHRLRLGYIGRLDYRLEAGKYWGVLPYPLLELHDGNETFFLNRTAFNTMNYYEFASDEYVSLFLTHHFQGLFFNRIPLLRKLKWREVVSGKAVIGNLSDANKEILQIPGTLHELNEPYIEASAGIENIFSFLRVDAIWRLSYLDHPNIVKFGIRGTVQFGF